MKRKKRSLGSHISHERWIVSYADFVTLLFAFFVVLFATANSDKVKARAVGESVKAAFEEGKFSNVATAISKTIDRERDLHEKPDSATAEPIKLDTKTPRDDAGNSLELLPLMEKLQQQLRAEVQKGDVEIHMEPRGLAISFKQAALFDSGDDRLKHSAYEAIGRVGEAIRLIPNQVRLEGNTDNIPIHNLRFESNWELSTARSIAVLNLLINQYQFPSKRLAVSGYADVAPVAPNDTEQGRARNRRVDVVILSEKAGTAEPAGKLKAPAH